MLLCEVAFQFALGGEGFHAVFHEAGVIVRFDTVQFEGLKVVELLITLLTVEAFNFVSFGLVLVLLHVMKKIRLQLVSSGALCTSKFVTNVSVFPKLLLRGKLFVAVLTSSLMFVLLVLDQLVHALVGLVALWSRAGEEEGLFVTRFDIVGSCWLGVDLHWFWTVVEGLVVSQLITRGEAHVTFVTVE